MLLVVLFRLVVLVAVLYFALRAGRNLWAAIRADDSPPPPTLRPPLPEPPRVRRPEREVEDARWVDL